MALHKDVTFLRGMQDTYDAISQDRPLDISTDIAIFDPNANQGLGYVMGKAGKKPASQRTFGHLEDVASRNWVEYQGINEASQAVTGLVFATGTNQLIGLGSRVKSTRTGEIIRLTADMASATDTAAVGRNFGAGTATSLLKTGDKLVILPPAMYEGFDTEEGYSHGIVYKSFNMTETSFPVDVSFVENATEHRSGNPFNRALSHAWKQFKDQKEIEMILSGDKLTSAAGGVVGASQGMDTYVTTNVFTATNISRLDMWDIIGIWKSFYKAPGGAIFCSHIVRAILCEWAWDKTEITIPVSGQSGKGMIGTTIDRINTPWGRFDLIPIDVLGQDPFLAGTVYFVPDPAQNMKHRFLPGLDIHYRPIVKDEHHSKLGEIYGVTGWHFRNEEQWAKLEGWIVAA